MKDNTFAYTWNFKSDFSPEELWPLIADTNTLFKDMGQLPVQEVPVSHDLKKGHKELTYSQLHRLDIWEEEPYQWEAPYHLCIKREYKSGAYKKLLISIDLLSTDFGSKITFRFSGTARRFTGKFWIRRQFRGLFKRRLKNIIKQYDEALSKHRLPNLNPKKSGWFRGNRKWTSLEHQLSEYSGDKKLSNLVIGLIRDGSEANVSSIQPIKLAGIWNVDLQKLLNLLFYAAKLDILNFSWNLKCPDCNHSVTTVEKLNQIVEPLHCAGCSNTFRLDFNDSIELIFKPHPLVRKITGSVYCLNNPMRTPQRALNQYIYPGQKRFVKLKLNSGRYRISAGGIETVVYADVEEKGIENATITFRENEDNIHHVSISQNPGFIICNQTNQPIVVTVDDMDTSRYMIGASEVCSNELFQNLFPGELIRDKEKFNLSNLTVMFTDLSNSSMMYAFDGDESATRQVITHFELLRAAINEERGAIVKTIGDSVMAIFQKPGNAVRAFHKAQKKLKSGSGHRHPVQLKAGIHSGPGIVVTLNNRIDYFGNTVITASRLVEQASGNELVISDTAYATCKTVQNFIMENRKDINIHHFDAPLKGMDYQTCEAKRIQLQSQALRLVV